MTLLNKLQRETTKILRRMIDEQGTLSICESECVTVSWGNDGDFDSYYAHALYPGGDNRVEVAVDEDVEDFDSEELDVTTMPALLDVIAPDTFSLAVYVALRDLIPKTMDDWFWQGFSADAPFSWGDNNVTLITASRAAEHIRRRVLPFLEDDEFEPKADLLKVLERLDALQETYINLEN